MRRAGARGLAAVLVLGLLGSVAAAQAPAGKYNPAPAPIRWPSWLVGRSAATNKDPAVQKVLTGEEARAVATLTVEQAAEEQQRQLNAFLRRTQVCDRLKQIALQNNDTELERQADLLQQRAFEIYQQQVATLPRPAARNSQAVPPGRPAAGTVIEVPAPGLASER
jgi:hypothetical protein